jgi:predicted  nucleic acid-binding Zn-ribbon protein
MHVVEASKQKESEFKTEISGLKQEIDEKNHIQKRLEKEAKKTQILTDEQNERIQKLTKEVDDFQEEVKNIRVKAAEEKKKFLDQKEQLNEKIHTMDNDLLDAGRNLTKERESKKKMREECDDEIDRLKKEQEKNHKYWQDREVKYINDINELNQYKIVMESKKRKEINDMMEEMSKLREDNRNLSRSAMEFKANVEALEEQAKLYERR